MPFGTLGYVFDLGWERNLIECTIFFWRKLINLCLFLSVIGMPVAVNQKAFEQEVSSDPNPWLFAVDKGSL